MTFVLGQSTTSGRKGKTMSICEPTVRPMATLWHLTHMDMGNVSMMSGTSLTMPSRHL
jgi:hypothetical protein